MIEPKSSGLFVAWLVWLAGVSFVPVADSHRMHVKRHAIAQADVRADQEVQILQDHIMMLWVGMGAIGGGYVCAAAKTIRLKQMKEVDPSLSTRLGVVIYASVGTITSIFVSPWVVKRYLSPGQNGNGIEAVPLVSFLMAFLIWFVLEVAEIIYNRIRDRAKKSGLAGVREELSGRLMITSTDAEPVREAAKPDGKPQQGSH